MTILALLLPVIAACWVGWIGWHSSGAKRLQVFRWAAGLSIAAVSMVIPTFVVTVGLGMGASGAEGVPDWLLLSFFLSAAIWIAFGLVALMLADSWKTGFQIIGWEVLCAVVCLVPGILLLFSAA